MSDTATESVIEPTGDADEAPEEAPEEDAPTEEPAEESSDDGTKAKRRVMGERGWLQKAIRTLTDNYIRGTVTVPDDKPLTPHRAAALLVDQGLAEEPPSTGAVSAVFKRWQEYGFATFTDKPFAFVGYTDEARDLGFDGIMEKRSAERKAARAAAKASESTSDGDDD